MTRHYSDARKAAYRASERKRRELSERRKTGTVRKMVAQGVLS